MTQGRLKIVPGGRAHPGSRSGRLIAGAICLTALAVAVIAALAHLLPDGRPAYFADVVSPLLVHTSLGGFVAVLALLLRRRTWPILLLGLPAIVVGHALAAQWQSTSTPFSRGPSSVIRVLSLNTWHEHPDIDAIERGIELSNADIVVLIEAGPDKIPMIERLARIYPFKESCAARWECSVAILSRFPIRRGDANRTHLEIPPLAWADVDAREAGLGAFRVIATHVHRPSRSPRIHRAQMRALADFARKSPDPVILAGDFNTGALAASWNELIAATSFKSAMVFAPTWPSIPLIVPQVALDHILISPQLGFGRTGTGPFVGSDHLGIWAEVTPPPVSPLARAIRPAATP